MSRRPLLAILGAAVAAAAATPSAHAAATPGVVQGEVLVRYEPAAGAADRQDVRDEVDGTRARGVPLPRTELIRVDPGEDERAVAARLERDPRVRWAEPNALYRVARVPNDPRFTTDPFSSVNQWHLPAISAPAAWDETVGSPNVVVAVLDTGVDLGHSDLRNQIWTNPGEAGDKSADGIDNDHNGRIDDYRGWDFADSLTGDNDPQDHEGHGTHVAGLAGAEADNGLFGTGVAWNARLMPVAFINAGGTGTTAGIIASIDYAAQNGASIVNGSFTGAASPGIDDAIRRAPNVLFVFAAGNEGRNVSANPLVYPCLSPEANVVCVGATDEDDDPAVFSNRGIGVDLFAPGDGIRSTTEADGFGPLSGTSMATPIVAGTAALMKSQSPWATPAELADALRAGVDTRPALSSVTVSGGRLNAARSVSLITDRDPPAPFVLTSPAASVVTKDRRVTVAWTPTSDAHSGVARQIVTLDGAPAVTLDPGATSAALPGELSDGLHRIAVVAEDRAGNQRESTGALVRIDYAAPRAASLVIIDPAPRRSATFDISWAAAVDDGGLAYQEVLVDGEVIERTGPEATTATIPALQHGRHLVSVRAVDLVGNASESARVPVNVDERAPALRLNLGATPSALARGRLTVRCRPSEETQGCEVRVALAGGRSLTRTIELRTNAPRIVRLSKSARRAVARAARQGNVRLVLSATATDTAGNTARRTLRATRRGAAVRRALAR